MKLFLKDTKRPGWKLYLTIAKVLMYIPAKYLFWLLVILREMCVFLKVNKFYTNFDIAVNENQVTGGCDHGKSGHPIHFTFQESSANMCCDHQIILSDQRCANPAFKPRENTQ